jgi:hypothetical protein
MAAGRTLLLSVALCMSTAVAVNVVATEKSSSTMVRREVDLDPSGHVMKVMVHDQPTRKASTITDCNKQFLVMAEGSDDCGDKGEVIEFEGDCLHAASQLKLVNSAIDAAPKDNSSTGFMLNTHLVNPLPYPSGCFLNTSTGKVHVNLGETNSTGHTIANTATTLQGKKICMRTLYTNGTANSNPDSGCGDDSDPILNYDECCIAAGCVAGGDMFCNGANTLLSFGNAPELQPFKENHTDYMPNDKPMGCFKDQGGQAVGDTLGYWGFNYKATAPTGALTGTPVCKNKVLPANSVAAAASAPATSM